MTDRDRHRPSEADLTPYARSGRPDQGQTHGDNTVSTASQQSAQRSALMDLHRRLDDLTDSDATPCQENDAELWFAESPADVEFAKALCGSCPIREQCLAGALERREPWGVWGGELFVSGAVVARKRPRGRPRKHPVAA